MYPEFGTVVRFTISKDLDIQEMGDMDFRLAQITLQNGATAYASFENREFQSIKRSATVMEARVCHQVFNAPAASGRFTIHSFGAEPTAEQVTLMLKINPDHLNLSDRPVLLGYRAPGTRCLTERGMAVAEYARLKKPNGPEEPPRSTSFLQRVIGWVRSPAP